MRLISGDEMPGLLPVEDAVSLMGKAFKLISGVKATLADRQSLELATGTGLLMGAALESHGIAAKMVSVMPDNLSKGLPGSIGLVLLMDAGTGEPLALMDGSCLTAIRTAALNAFAVNLLSRPDSRTALLIGCGTQAEAQLAALVTVRPLEQVKVMGRDTGRTQEFAEYYRRLIDADLVVEMDPIAATNGVDIIVAATNSSNPVLDGALVPAGCHVSGIGSFKRGMREYDDKLLLKASIFVESRQTAELEAGELMHAVETGVTLAANWTEIGEVLMGDRSGRKDADEITYFKSVGHAVFDLLAARAVWENAVEQDVGTRWQP